MTARRATGTHRPRRAREWGRWRLRRNDSGAHTVEFAIIAGPLLLVTFMVIQTALVFYARSTALAAATQGANAARTYGSNPYVAGKDKAERFLAVIGGGLRDPEVTVESSGTSVTVTVTGKAPGVIPFMTFKITQSASGPIERFVP
jgi:hypothetical protein